MTQIFFAPRSNETSYENFQSTITYGVEPSRILPHLSPEERQEFGSHSVFYVWGNKETKRPTWEKMNRGDIVLFYAEGEFVYAGVCLFKKHSQPLAKEMWPEDPKAPGIHWNCVFFLRDMQKISLPLKKIIQLCNYEEKFVVQGFMPMNATGVAAVEQEFGSPELFVSHFRYGLTKADAKALYEVAADLEDASAIAEADQMIEEAGGIDDAILELRQTNQDVAPITMQAIVTRIERNRKLVDGLKKLYQYKCQVCGIKIPKKDKGFYCEVAHVRAIATRQIGVDALSNMVVLCPNHHKMLDFGRIEFAKNFTLLIEDKPHVLSVKSEHNLSWPA
jgi:hypothetical protein